MTAAQTAFMGFFSNIVTHKPKYVAMYRMMHPCCKKRTYTQHGCHAEKLLCKGF